MTPQTRVEPIEDAAIRLGSETAGARVHHNLIRHNSLGIDLGSDGSATTRVVRNCLRENDFGMPPRGRTSSAELWTTTRPSGTPGSATRSGTTSGPDSQLCPQRLPPRRPRLFRAEQRERLDHRRRPRARLDRRTARQREHQRQDHRQPDRWWNGGGCGVLRRPRPDITEGTGRGQRHRGFGRAPTAGLGIAVANAAGLPSVDGVKVMDNMLSHNAVGISVRLNNPGVRMHGNTSVDNRQFGIRAQLQVGTASSASSRTTSCSTTGPRSGHHGRRIRQQPVSEHLVRQRVRARHTDRHDLWDLTCANLDGCAPAPGAPATQRPRTASGTPRRASWPKSLLLVRAQ